MRPSRTFVPDSLGALEKRDVPSSGFYNGMAVLNHGTYNSAVQQINNAFNQFYKTGNGGQLYNNLARSISNIPYHYMSGLNNQMLSIVYQLGTSLQQGNFASIEQARIAAITSLNANIFGLTSYGYVSFR